MIIHTVTPVMHRRALLRALVAAGGSAALAACLNLEGDPTIGTGDPETRPARQHAWNAHLDTDDHGNYRLPEHHVFLSVSYDGSDRDADREHIETAFTDLERAYEASTSGLLFTVGYTPEYFERFDESPAVDLPPAGPVVPGENVGTLDGDMYIHLASDHASAVLKARDALLGDGRANDQPVTSITDCCTLENRRTGFIGPGLPAENDGGVGIPSGEVSSGAPTFMGFQAGFRGNQATEDRVTIQSGPFTGGTTQHVEMLRHTLNEWFDRTPDEQVARLFSPGLDAETVGEHGESLTDHNQVEAVDEETLFEIAETEGIVGHAQKLSRFREADGRPPILRRDVNTADNGEAGMIFVSLQRAFEDFRELRVAMAGHDLAEETPVRDRRGNGIRQYFRTRQRENVLIPPRDQRALPTAVDGQ